MFIFPCSAHEEKQLTSDTFGIKSPAPVEVNIGGQKFTFPDLPEGGDENLPQIFFVNPVKADGGASTLPSRKKNKINPSDRASIIDPDIFIPEMKTSKSTSEINKDTSSDPQSLGSPVPTSDKSRKESTIYDIPRLVVQPKAKESTPSKSPDYVKLEPCSKVQESVITTEDKEPLKIDIFKSDTLESSFDKVKTFGRFSKDNFTGSSEN